MASIGERILNLRRELNLNQKQLAEKIGITEASLSRYENNLREPRAEIVAELAKVFDCSADYILGRTNVRYEDISKLKEWDTKSIDYKNYEEIKDKILDKLVDEGIVKKEEPLPKEALDKVIKYGIDAAIEILKLKKSIGDKK